MRERIYEVFRARRAVILPSLVWLSGVVAGSIVTLTVMTMGGPTQPVGTPVIKATVIAPAGNEDLARVLVPPPRKPRAPKEQAATAVRPDAQKPDARKDVAVAEAPSPEKTRSLTVRSGDTLMKLMLDAKIPRDQAHAAITALREIYDPRDLMPGQRIEVSYRPTAPEIGATLLERVHLQPDVQRVVTVERNEDATFHAVETVKTLTPKLALTAGAITHSLYVDGIDAGLPLDTLIELIRIYSWDVDFQREIRQGDHFEVVYEKLYDEDGKYRRNGAILYAKLTLSGVDYPLYRYEYDKGLVDYFDDHGKSARKPLMRTPIDGARLSSGYGMRRHPILGYTRMHRGVDFAAAQGTPIYAAGDGRVEVAGRNGSYGNYIRIRHNGRYKTAYAHIYRFARGIHAGKRVKQGQVIAYVGSTGRATGPHLHFEILVDGSQVNPRRVKLPSGHVLKGRQLADFSAAREAIDQQIAGLAAPQSIAQSD